MKQFLLALIVSCVVTQSSRADQKPDLYLYYPTNLLVDRNVDQIQDIWKRAADAGYSRVVLADSKLVRLGKLEGSEKHYMANVARVKAIAQRLHLQIIPAVFPVGYSNDLLFHDPNLAEGLPVRDQPFVVRDRELAPVADPNVRLGPAPSWKDDDVVLADGVATVTNNATNARFAYRLSLSPFRCYHVSVQIRTDHFTAQPEIKAIPQGNPKPAQAELQYESLGIKPTQDWKRVDVVFNMFESQSVVLYFGVWGEAKGTLQWKNWNLEESPLVNVLHRPGAPCVVKDAATNRVYTEVTNYDPIVDPKLGVTPWPGEYDGWHQPPVIKTSLPEGTKLLISWYYPAIIYDGQVPACFNEPATQALLADEAKRVRAAFGAGGYLMSHDEIRVMNWDESCQDKHETPGNLLADNARYCTRLLSGSTAYVWSDMFDPSHNAHDRYYLVNGDLAGSWEGLSPDVVVVNWNFAKRDRSLKFFADRGNPQVIAGYYDGKVEQVREWLASAAKVKGVVGIMYTTWRHDYDQIEAFARLCRE